jgi:hypothetical protein
VAKAKANTQTKQELKAAARTAKSERKAQRKERRGQIGQVFKLARTSDPKLIWVLVGVFVGTLLVVGTLFYLLFGPIFGGILALIAALVVTAAIFSRRAQRAVFAQVEGQPGAPLGVLQGLPRGWISSDMPVAFTRDQDFVHRLLGRPGIVLIGEGNPKRVAQLLQTEKKKVQRVAAEVPVYEIVVGDGEGQVPLRKLRSHLVKLPRNLKPAGVSALDKRMRALGGAGSLPIPKGPMPKSARAVKRGR